MSRSSSYLNCWHENGGFKGEASKKQPKFKKKNMKWCESTLTKSYPQGNLPEPDRFTDKLIHSSLFNEFIKIQRVKQKISFEKSGEPEVGSVTEP